MCTISGVFDTGKKMWPNEYWITPPAPSVPELGILKKFLELLEKAKEFDTVSGQPDCEDPDKAKILDKILERIEVLEKAVGIQETETVVSADTITGWLLIGKRVLVVTPEREDLDKLHRKILDNPQLTASHIARNTQRELSLTSEGYLCLVNTAEGLVGGSFDIVVCTPVCPNMIKELAYPTLAFTGGIFMEAELEL